MQVPKWWSKSEERIKGVYMEGYKRAYLEMARSFGNEFVEFDAWYACDVLSAEESYEEWLKERQG